MWLAYVQKTAFRTHDDLYEFLVMAFGLCNAATAFQTLMNDVLRSFLHRFVLVFFDDILIYNNTWADLLRHIRVVFFELRQHQLYVKRTKCAFSTASISYLGHVISETGIAMDSAKVHAIHDWPAPRSARAVRGFLGLAGYYRKFVHNYGAVAVLLTVLLKMDDFWNEDAATTFTTLKDMVTSAPILAMSDFSKPFVVEYNASSHGFGAVLVQDGHPIAFFSRTIAPRHRALAAYERELIDLVQAICHWRPYLLGHRFLVKTDHYNLKYLLDQRLATIPQHHWVGKTSPLNTSLVWQMWWRTHSPTVTRSRGRASTSSPAFVRLSPSTSPSPPFRRRCTHALLGASWTVLDGMVQYAGRLYIPPTSPLLQEIMEAIHAKGHEGVQRTLHRLR
jgi:hypothetical protein